MATTGLLLLFLAEFVGATVYPINYARDTRGHFVGHNSINASDVTSVAHERTVIAGALAIGSVAVSLWSSVFATKAVEIDISNRMATSLNDPTWYTAYGYVTVLPPFSIQENEPSTQIQFQKTKGSTFGTEGVVCYQIGSQRTLNLVIMWKLPQLDDTAFFIKIKKGDAITPQNLEKMFNDIEENQQWFHVRNHHQWQTRKEEGLTWKAAMGTRDLTTLKVVIME